MRIKQQYDLNILDKYVDKGLLDKQEDEYLVQYMYSNKVYKEGLWDEITTFNHGNIYEKCTGRIIARGNTSIISQDVNLNFGILYKYKNKIRCNSTCGFNNGTTQSIIELLPKYDRLQYILEYNILNVIISASRDYLNLLTSFSIGAWTINDEWQNYTIQDVTGIQLFNKDILCNNKQIN